MLEGMSSPLSKERLTANRCLTMKDTAAADYVTNVLEDDFVQEVEIPTTVVGGYFQISSAACSVFRIGLDALLDQVVATA